MLIMMRKTVVAVCFALVLGCSGGDGDSDDGSAGSSSGAHGGATTHGGSSVTGTSGKSNGSAGSSSTTGGRNSNGGSTGKAGSSSTAGTSNMAGSGGASTVPDDAYGDARIRCVNRTNELRATKGLAPIARLASAEPCVDGQAKSDSESGKAHGAFSACLDQVKGWKGVAQNECPNYSSVEDTLTKCLDAMWAEGPGGGHYDNMISDSTKTACGIYTTPAGKVWLIQDFWTE